MTAALVVLAGPSCAVLLIPQSQDWPAGRSLFHLKGNVDQIWPTSLSATSSTFREACVSAEATTFGISPSGGYYSIWTHYTQASLHKYKKVVPPYARQLSADDYYWSLASSPPVSTRTISLGIWNSSAADATQLVQPRLGVSVILERLMEDWWQALQAKGYYASDNVEDRAAISHSHMPMTSVKCSAARNMSAADKIHSDGYWFWQGWYPKELKWADVYTNSGQPLFNGSTALDDMKAIATDVGWLDMLTPPIGQGQPGYQGWAPTTIEGVLVYSHNLMAFLIATVKVPSIVFNDGLARFGIEDAFDQEGVPSNWISSAPTTTNNTTGNTTELKVKFTIGGLSYQLTVVQKLAAAVLLLHILIALVHSAWLILWTGESSGCWDSVTELVVLAQNSQPAFAALGNAAAGIKRSLTFASNMPLVDVAPGDTAHSLHPTRVQVGHAYG
ncbi:MAG: hypothetical protein Q9185_002280 [Variospora sp. 1 TL-2023]